MLLKSVYQWDIDSADDLAKFREDSGEIDQQAERVIYRRGDNIAPGEFIVKPRMQNAARKGKRRSTPRNQRRYNTAAPYMGREEFLERASEDLGQGFPFEADQYYRVYDGHDEHDTIGRDIPRGIVVRAVVEHRGIRDCHEDGNGRAGYIVEDEAGEMRMDEELFLRIASRNAEDEMVMDTVKRLSRKDPDDNQDLLKQIIGIE